ncbi:UMTA methyltransferase family protein [Aspergillus ellipticus CBS 707.79]|uniref:UMTA methyltransferase family protein n=1 Tax=Aspergillus ellipticus CBS 707.79 TaxID=1448320 RepID=A0A319D7A7_9EURO|nr:UMTA methyltransferase family protein [Aspergillus ellipticus CBS 707.79]
MGDQPASPPASFQLADGHGYALSNNHRASSRLNLQHYLWRESFRFNIHPSIPLPSTHPATIADIATGTALWLLDVSQTHPTSHLHGLDIDLTQAPHPQWLPSNITLQHWDLFTPVPPPLHQKYDLIHIRLLVLVLSGLDPIPVLRRLFSLLNPGGYIQWDELDCINMCVKKVDDSIATPALDELRCVYYANGRHDWALELPELLQRVGFEDMRMEKYGEGPELMHAFGHQHLLTVEEFTEKLPKQGMGVAAERLRRVIDMAQEEMVGGAALSVPRVVVVGRRPVL